MTHCYQLTITTFPAFDTSLMAHFLDHLYCFVSIKNPNVSIFHIIHISEYIRNCFEHSVSRAVLISVMINRIRVLIEMNIPVIGHIQIDNYLESESNSANSICNKIHQSNR